jgi:hypothetical protein
MNSLLDLLRLALERLWTVGLVAALFFGLALTAVHYGATLPPDVAEWALPGLLFGIVLIAVSLTEHLRGALSGCLKRWKQRRRAKDEASRNLATLDQDELKMFYDFLRAAPPRFAVQVGSPAERLAQKNVLHIVNLINGTFVNPDTLICEIRSELVAMSAELLSELARTFDEESTPQKNGG